MRSMMEAVGVGVRGGRTRETEIYSTVHVLPVPDLENDDHELPAGHAVDDAVHADADPEHIVITHELARAR